MRENIEIAMLCGGAADQEEVHTIWGAVLIQVWLLGIIGEYSTYHDHTRDPIGNTLQHIRTAVVQLP